MIKNVKSNEECVTKKKRDMWNEGNELKGERAMSREKKKFRNL